MFSYNHCLYLIGGVKRKISENNTNPKKIPKMPYKYYDLSYEKPLHTKNLTFKFQKQN